MPQLSSINRVGALLAISIVLTFTITSFVHQGVSHAGGGCVASLAEGSAPEPYWFYESQRIGWPLPWLEIVTEGCFVQRASRPVLNAGGLLTNAAASVLVFGLLMAATRRRATDHEASSVSPSATAHQLPER
jgi:hypothetical protein